MTSLASILVPLALLSAPVASVPEALEESPPPAVAVAPVWHDLANAFRPPPQDQVRIERRVIIRITPRQPAPDALSALPDGEMELHYNERRIGKCLPIGLIAGVQADRGSRLLLFLRDRRIIAVNLEKTCRARDFYSGFYVERSDDGLLCSGRDKLHSRAGAKCEIDRLGQLVAVRR